MGITASPTSATPSNPLLLTGVTVVDTRTGALTPNQSVLLASGKIQQIVPAGATIEAASDPALQTIDASGKFLVPGFLDMHSHLLQSEHSTEYASTLMLAFGITGTRQMAGSNELLRARRNGTLPIGPHCPEILSLPGELLTPLNASTPEAGVAEVQRQKAEGADFIKTIFVSPKTFFATLAESKRLGLVYDGHLSPGVDVARASREGMGVIEHVGPTELTLIAVSTRGWLINLIIKLRPPKGPDLSPEAMKKAGRIMLANPILGRLNMDPEALSKTKGLIDSFSDSKARALASTFATHGTWQCLTLIRNATMRLGDDPLYTQSPDLRYITSDARAFWSSVARMYSAKVSPAGRDTLRRLGDIELKLTRIFEDAGVKLLAGSDFGGGWVIPGVSLHQEFDLLADAGLTSLRILQMTTLNGAEFLNRTATMGTVEPGKDANLVLLNADPIASAQNLHAIHAVVRDGAFYSEQALADLKETVAGRIAAEEPDSGDAADEVIP